MAPSPELLVLTMPAVVTAEYVVASPEGPPSPAAVGELTESLPERVTLDVTEISGDHPLLASALDVMSCPDCSPDLDPLVPVLIDATAGHLAIRCSGPPGWPPHHLTEGAYATDRVAQLTGGIRLDPHVPRLLPDPWRPAQLTTPKAFAVSDWVTVGAGREESSRLSLHTTGLAAFGLPELRARELEADQMHGWWHLFLGLSALLVRRTFELDDRTLIFPAEPSVEIPGSPPLVVEVGVRHLDGILHVVAPESYAGLAESWPSWVAASICGA
jgi:hypothetical protein